jgi:uncharacterized protein YbaP (TraB family)
MMQVSLTLRSLALAALLCGTGATHAAETSATPAVPPAGAVTPGAIPPVGAPPPPGSADYDPTRPSAAPAELPRLVPPAALRQAGRSFLWEVKSKSNTVYLFGTIHVGKAAFYPLAEPVEGAFAASRKVVVEADITRDGGMAAVKSLITYEPPDSLDQHIPADLYARLNAQLGPLGIPIRAARTMKPYVIAGLLAIAEYQRLGYDMNRGVDAYLIEHARSAGKPILELESQRGQIEMLAGMPAELQEAFLDNALVALEKKLSGDQVAGVVKAWQTGDARLMEEVNATAAAAMRLQPRLDDVFLHQRHPGMLKKIEGFLAEREPCFVAVGSLHLIGKGGLLQMLRDKGYEVNQK